MQLGNFIITDHTINKNKCQHAKVKDPPPIYLHNSQNYKQLMREQGKSEQEILIHGDNDWKNATFLYQINYERVYGKPCPYKFPHDPWKAAQLERPVKKSKKAKQEKRESVKQVRPEIRIHADTLREILTMGLSQLEYDAYFAVATEILQWQHHRDNDYAAKISQTKIAQMLAGRVRLDRVKYALAELENRGLIKIIKKPNCKTCKGQVIQLLKY